MAKKIVHFCSPNYNDAVLQSLFSSHVGVRKRSRVIGKWKSDSKRAGDGEVLVAWLMILSSVVLAHIQVGRQRTNGHIVAISHAEPNTHSLCLGVGLNECDLADCSGALKALCNSASVVPTRVRVGDHPTIGRM